MLPKSTELFNCYCRDCTSFDRINKCQSNMKDYNKTNFINTKYAPTLIADHFKYLVQISGNTNLLTVTRNHYE